MTPEVKKVVVTQPQQQTPKVNNSQTPSSNPVGVGQSGNDAVLQEHLDFLGIDYEHYMFYCEKYKSINFVAMSKEEQLKHLEKELQMTEAKAPVTEQMTETELAAHCAKIGATIEEYQHLCKYNKEFSSYSIEKQKELIDYARAKNMDILQLGIETEEEKRKKAELEAWREQQAQQQLQAIMEESASEEPVHNLGKIEQEALQRVSDIVNTEEPEQAIEIIEQDYVYIDEQVEEEVLVTDSMYKEIYAKVLDEQGRIDYNKYDELSWFDKRAILLNEIAKYEYNLTKKEDAKAWEDLSIEHRTDLMEELSCSNFAAQLECFGTNEPELIDFYYKGKMEEFAAWKHHVITSSEENASFTAYENLSQLEKANIRHEFLYDLAFLEDLPDEEKSAYIFGDPKLFTSEQKEYSRNQMLKTRAIAQKLNDLGIETNLNSENTSHSISPSEISNYLKEINEKLKASGEKGISLEELFYEYLNANKEELNEKDLKILEKLEIQINTFNNSTFSEEAMEFFNEKPITNYLDEIKNIPAWQNANDIAVRKSLLVAYINKQCKNKNLSPEEKIQLFNDLAQEIRTQPCPAGKDEVTFKKDNAMLVQQVSAYLVEHATEQELEAFKKLSGSCINVAATSADFSNEIVKSEDDATNIYNLLKMWKFPFLANKALENMNKDPESSTEAQGRFATLMSKDGENPEGQKLSVDAARLLSHKGEDGREYTEEIIGDIRDNGLQNVQEYALNSSTGFHKDSQVPAYEILTEDNPSLTQFAIDNEIPLKYHRENQPEIFEISRQQTEEHLPKEEAIEYGKKLSDLVEKADASVQLDLHKVMMDSKYAEVVEHTADNIKDYDNSVKQKALETVYEYAETTGNQKPLEKALEGLIDNKTPQIVQEAELPKAFEQIIVQNAIRNEELQELDITQELSAIEVASLPSDKKQKYYINIFKKASANDQMKLLSKLPNGTQKKIVITLIARCEPGLLKDMVKNGLGPVMLASNLPFDVSNKILQLMVQSNDDQVKKQVADLINDKDYHERIQDMFASKDDRILDNDREKALENSYMSLPQDFMRANDITPEEMQRMQKTMWLLDKAGRFKA